MKIFHWKDIVGCKITTSANALVPFAREQAEESFVKLTENFDNTFDIFKIFTPRDLDAC